MTKATLFGIVLLAGMFEFVRRGLARATNNGGGSQGTSTYQGPSQSAPTQPRAGGVDQPGELRELDTGRRPRTGDSLVKNHIRCRPPDRVRKDVAVGVFDVASRGQSARKAGDLNGGKLLAD